MAKTCGTLLAIFVGITVGFHVQYEEPSYADEFPWPSFFQSAEQLEAERVADMLAHYAYANEHTQPRKREFIDLFKPEGKSRSFSAGHIALLTVVACCCTLVVVGVLAGIVVRYHRGRASATKELSRSTSPHESLMDVDSGDKKLAHSAQMYHYQHQKQQMLAMERAAQEGLNHASSEEDEDSDIELDDANCKVYECPGLAETGELEVDNPLFMHGDEDSQGSNEEPHSAPLSDERANAATPTGRP